MESMNAPADESDADGGVAGDAAARAIPENTVLAMPITGQPLAAAETPETHVRPLDCHQSAIRLRRLRAPTLPSVCTPAQFPEQQLVENGRRRSSSEPHRPSLPIGTALPALPRVDEAGEHQLKPGRRRLTVQGLPVSQAQRDDCYDPRIVDFLDVVDPEVATLSSITNIQNSLFVPSLGKWVNRRPIYDLSQLPMPGAFPLSTKDVSRFAITERDRAEQLPVRARSPSISSVLTEPQYAILPNDASLAGWAEEDIKALNDYVRHMLHSRRSKIKQRLKAFVKYASKPLGFLVTLYATLITVFGLAWVLFLIGWIYVGDKQLYVINVIDYILVALFAIVGDGLAPFRAIDTYHMVFVAHYHRKTWKLRKTLLLPELRDHNDLPTENGEERAEPDLEAQDGQHRDEFFPVLSEKEQSRLEHHQTKLANSHTFYKPHETETHRAFPLRLLIAVVLLLDLHSCLQIALGACTWGIPYDVRPTALTTTILCCSIATNIAAGALISIGDRRTRKRDVLDRLLKQDLTSEAMKKLQKNKEKESRKRESGDGIDKHAQTSLSASLRASMRIGGERNGGENDCDDPVRSTGYTTGMDEKDQVGKRQLQVPGDLLRTEVEKQSGPVAVYPSGSSGA